MHKGIVHTTCMPVICHIQTYMMMVFFGILVSCSVTVEKPKRKKNNKPSKMISLSYS